MLILQRRTGEVVHVGTVRVFVGRVNWTEWSVRLGIEDGSPVVVPLGGTVPLVSGVSASLLRLDWVCAGTERVDLGFHADRSIRIRRAELAPLDSQAASVI